MHKHHILTRNNPIKALEKLSTVGHHSSWNWTPLLLVPQVWNRQWSYCCKRQTCTPVNHEEKSHPDRGLWLSIWKRSNCYTQLMRGNYPETRIVLHCGIWNWVDFAVLDHQLKLKFQLTSNGRRLRSITLWHLELSWLKSQLKFQLTSNLVQLQRAFPTHKINASRIQDKYPITNTK
jgi:hypothetical protein